MDLSRLRGKLPEAEGDLAIATRPSQLLRRCRRPCGKWGSLVAPSSDGASFLSVPSPLPRSLAGCQSFLNITLSRKFLSFVQRQEGYERLKVLTIDVALRKWIGEKLAQQGHL